MEQINIKTQLAPLDWGCAPCALLKPKMVGTLVKCFTTSPIFVKLHETYKNVSPVWGGITS